MRPVTFLVAVLAVAPFSRVTAQEAPPVKVGDRVRVTAPDVGVRNRDGTLQLLDADSLVMRPEYGGPSLLVIPLASLTRLELYGGRGFSGWNVLRGAGIGVLVGGAVGAGIGYLTSSEGCGEFERSFCAGVGAAVLGGAGLVIGAGVGAAVKSDRWEEVPLDQLRVSFAPQRNGRFGLGLSVQF